MKMNGGPYKRAAEDRVCSRAAHPTRKSTSLLRRKVAPGDIKEVTLGKAAVLRLAVTKA